MLAGYRRTMRKRRVVIIGGGITGLAAAHRLQRLDASLAVTLLERSARLGGRIRTERKDGFILELGPDIFLSSKPRGLGLCQELGLPAVETDPELRGSYLERKGSLHRLPEGMSGLVPTRVGPVFRSSLLSPGAKLRFALHSIIPRRRRKADESIAAFFTRRVGRGAYEQLIDPVLGGIYGGDGNRLSIQSTFPNLLQATRWGSAAGDTASKMGPFLSPKGGMQTLTDSLGAGLANAHFALETPVLAIRREHDSYVVLTGKGAFDADAIVLATPAHATAGIVAPLDAALAEEVGTIPYGSVITLAMAYRASDVPRRLDAYGYLVPRSEGKALTACTWSSSKLPNRAPAGAVLLRLFLGRKDTDPIFQVDDDTIVLYARKEVEATLGITGPPLFTRLLRQPRSMPQYVLGHNDRLRRIDQCLATLPGLYLAGAAYRGVGIPDCIADGERAAEQVAAFV